MPRPPSPLPGSFRRWHLAILRPCLLTPRYLQALTGHENIIRLQNVLKAENDLARSPSASTCTCTSACAFASPSPSPSPSARPLLHPAPPPVGHLPRLRLHGDGPARRHPRQHPRAGAQAVHRVPVPQGAALLPLRRADPPRPQAVEPAAQRGVPAEGRRLRPRALPPRHREGRRERERAPRNSAEFSASQVLGAQFLCAQFF